MHHRLALRSSHKLQMETTESICGEATNTARNLYSNGLIYLTVQRLRISVYDNAVASSSF